MSATIRDVARKAGKSIAAASAVLNGRTGGTIRVSDETRRKIEEAARSLGYTPHPHARSLATRKSGVLGLVFPYVEAFTDQNPFCSRIMAGVFDEAVHRMQNVMLFTAVAGDSGTSPERSIVSPRVDGLIVVLPRPGSSVLEQCRRRGMPCVAVVHSPSDDTTVTVNADDYRGGRLAAEHLIELGHRRIAHLGGSRQVASAAPRWEGFADALRDAGIGPTEEALIPAGFDWVDGVAALESIMARPASQRPTAVFAANDLCAVGVLRQMKKLGLRAPDDLAVVGYDDTWLAATSEPPLTSVRMPIYEMGVMASAVLVSLIQGHDVSSRQAVLPVSLSVRASTVGTVGGTEVGSSGQTEPERR